MYTLKIRWMRYEQGEGNLIAVVDETTLFIAADEVKVHGILTSIEDMKAWDTGSFFDYSVRDVVTGDVHEARLIQVDRDNKPSVWYLASNAWILGPDGKTIERVV